MAGFALPLGYLTWPQAALMAGAALSFNALLLPRVAPGIIGADRIWSCAWVEDVARAHVAAAEHAAPGAAYALGGENLPQMEIFAAIETMTGRRRPWRIPSVAAVALGGWEELRARVFRASPLVTRGAVEIFSHDWPLDSSAAVRDLGYSVRPLFEGIGLLLENRSAEGQQGR